MTTYLSFQGVNDHRQQWEPLSKRRMIAWRSKPYVVRAYKDATHLVECWHLSKQEAWTLAQLYIGQKWSVVVKDNSDAVVFKSVGGTL